MNNMRIEISLQKKQREFLNAIDKYEIVGYGGARGGGKSVGLRYAHLIRRFKYPGSTGVIFRSTYPELESNHIRPLLTEFPQLISCWKEAKKQLVLPNGSIQLFRHCGSMKDAGLYQGQEWHDLGWDECGDTDEELFEFLRASNRSSNPDIPARCQLSFNWGHRAHKWLKRRFILKNFRSEERRSSHHFIPALMEDNPALMKADPGYGDRILSMASPALRKAWRYGDHDIDAGQYFELRHDVHLVDDFEIPNHWTRWCGYDYGWSHPAAMVWFAADEEGQLYIYRYWSESKNSIEDQAKRIHGFSDFKQFNSAIYAGHDCWADRGSAFSQFEKQTAPTIASQFESFGVNLIPANIQRKQGWSLLREAFNYNLGIDEDGDTAIIKEPKLSLFKSCKMVYDNLSDRIHNPSDLEDVLKEDHKEGVEGSGDDLSDATRYGHTSWITNTKAPPDPRKKYSQFRKAKYDRPSWKTA